MKKLKKVTALALTGAIALGALGLVDLPIGPETQKVSAASVTNYGVSINPVKNTFYASDWEASLAMSNSNKYDVSVKYWAQKKQSDGSWMMNGDAIGYLDIKAGKSVVGALRVGYPNANEGESASNVMAPGGTYRYKVEVSNTAGTLLGTIWSSEFKVVK